MFGNKAPPGNDDIEILLRLHNMAAVKPERAVEAGDIARTLCMRFEEMTSRLVELSRSGYVVSVKDDKGNNRFHLTGLGIIKVSSLFS